MDSWNSERVADLMQAMRAGDVSSIEEALTLWWPELSFDGRFPTVLEGLAMLDAGSLRSRPGLGLLAEIAGGLPSGSVQDPEVPDNDRLKAIGFSDEAKVWLQANLLACLRARRLGRMAHARRLVATGQVVAAAVRWAPRSSATELAPLWFATAGTTLLLAGDLSAVGPLLRMGHMLRDRVAYDRVYDPYPHLDDEIAESLTMLHALRGDLQQANALLDRRSRSGEWVTTLGGPGTDIIAVDRLDAAPPVRRVDSPVPVLSTQTDGWALELFARVHQALTWGRVDEAQQDIRDTAARGSGRLEHNSFARGIVRMLEVDVSLAAGDGDRARSQLGSDVPRWLVGRAARLDLMTGKPESAAEKATSALWSSSSGPRDRIEMLLLRAVARLRSGDDARAWADAVEAVDAARPHGHLRPFATVPREELTMLTRDVPALGPILDLLDAAGVAPIYPERADIVRLTDRERIVLEKISAGLPLTDVATTLYVSVNTVKTQLRSAYRKLGVDNRQDAVARVLDDDLLMTSTKDVS